jgi:hypothetical protein
MTNTSKTQVFTANKEKNRLDKLLLDWEVVQEEIDNLANPALRFNLSRKIFFLQDIVGASCGRSTKSVKIVFFSRGFSLNLG